MSVNVSLVESDTPGASLYFDGQPVQDLQEAELRREEERQAKELRHLLETELEDFEDDFLSGSNSEDEDGESFADESMQRSRDTRQHKSAQDQRLTSLSPAGSTHIQPHTASTHVQTHIGLNISDPQSQFPFVQTSKHNQEYEKLNLLYTQASAPHNGEINHKTVLDSKVHGSNIAQEDSNISDLYLSLPSSQQKFENFTAGENHFWSNEYSSLPGNISLTPSGQVFYHKGSQDSRHTFLPVQSGDHNVHGLAGKSLPSRKGVVDPSLDDEWMMQIKRSRVGAYSDPKGPQYNQAVYQNQPQWQTANHTNGFLQNDHSSGIPNKHLTMTHPETNIGAHSGMLPKPEEAKQNVLLQSQPPHQSIPSLPALQSSSSINSSRIALGANRDGQQMWTNKLPQLQDGGDGQLKQYKVQYQKPGLDAVGEEEFYLDNEHVDFFRKVNIVQFVLVNNMLDQLDFEKFEDGPEDRRSYEQLEILYRARGREIEEVTRRMQEAEEERGKEIRSLKHKLAMATGESEARDESLRQCQKLLQEAKADSTEVAGKVRALETQVSSFKNVKEELIKKLQTAESTIENMTHHIEELQDSESLSRARNEHDEIIARLTSRHQQELLAVREKLDASKTELDVKQEELNHLKKRLADMTQELETTQISRGNMINKLSRSLEDSQSHCQMLLEQSSSHEMSLLKVQLQQALASKRISEDLCSTFQSEVKELKEQLNMLESASNLGVFAAPSHALSAASHDDSMTDLGIRKTLSFDSPQSVPRSNRIKSSDNLINSLRSELEKCLAINKQKRSEVTEKTEEIKTLRAALEAAQNKIDILEKTCSEQKNRLQEMDLLSGSGVGVIEARLKRSIEDLKREKEVLLVDIEDYKKRLHEVGDSEAKLSEINSELSQQISQMVSEYDADKRAALESCQRTMEEVSGMSIEKLRQEMEERFESEKSMLTEHYRHKVDHLKRELSSAQLELDNVKSLYIKTCEESAAHETELTDKFQKQLEEELGKLRDKLEAEKRDWESFMRDQMAEEQESLKKSVREMVKSEWKAEVNKEKQLLLEQTKLACLEEQTLTWQMKLDESRKQWQENHDCDERLLTEEKEAAQKEVERLRQEISDLKLKLCSDSSDLVVAHEGVRLEFEAKLKSLEKNYKDEMNELVMRLDKEREQIREKVKNMRRRFSENVETSKSLISGIEINSTQGLNLENIADSTEKPSVEDWSESASNLLEELSILEEILREKETKLQELEKVVSSLQINSHLLPSSEIMIAEKEAQVNILELKLAEKERDVSAILENIDNVSPAKTNKNNLMEWNFNKGANFIYEGGESLEKLKEHIKNLESMLNAAEQKYTKDVEELKQKHEKDFEKAARVREDKYQAELRYFLKEKDDQCKTKLENFMKQCEVKAKLELERAIKEVSEKHKLDIEKTFDECEEKRKFELQKVIEGYEEKIRKETQSGDFEVGVHLKMKLEEVKEKMTREIIELRESSLAEKASLEMEVKYLKEERNNEIVNLSLHHEEIERKMRENFEEELATLKVEHQNSVRNLHLELEAQKSETEIAKRLLDSVRRESDGDKRMAEQLQKEVEKMKISLKEAQGVTEKIQEQRTKWFQDSQEYINREIKQGMEFKLREEQERIKKDLEEKLKKDLEEKIKKDLEEKLQKDFEEKKENFQKTVQERLQEEYERKKEQVEREKENEGKRKVEIEMENLKKKFVIELELRVVKEKSRLENEVLAWKEEAKRRMEEDRRKVKEALHTDKERILQEERRKLEFEMNKFRQEERKRYVEEMEEELREQIKQTRKEWEREKAEGDNSDEEKNISWRERLRSEVEARTKACSERDKAIEFLKSRELQFREEKQKLISGLRKCREDLEEMKKEHVSLEKKYMEMDMKYKSDMKEAKMVREQDLVRLRESLENEREKLVASFKTQLVELHHQHGAAMERVETEKMKVQKQAQLESLPVQLPDASSSTILELRDQYLDTVAKIKTDIMAHVQKANVQAAATMKAEIHKQRQKVIEVFQAKVKANFRSALNGQVSEATILALEHSIDLLSDHLIATTTMGSTPLRQEHISHDKQRSKHSSDDAVMNDKKPADIHENTGSRKNSGTTDTFNGKDFNQISSLYLTSPRTTDFTKLNHLHPDTDYQVYHISEAAQNPKAPFEQPVLDRNDNLKTFKDKHQAHHLQQNLEKYERIEEPTGPHPQLEKVDLFDSDTLPHSQSSSNNSSPASQTRIRSHLKSAARKHHVAVPDIPSLSPNISPRHRPTTSKAKSPPESVTDLAAGHSSRDEMKVIEARVRLANWARNGEMPWKPLNEKSEVKNLDSDGFVKPGLEAEQWLRAQRKMPHVAESNHHHSVQPTNNHGQGYRDFQLSSDSSDAASCSTNTSFLTLEPEVIDKCVSLAAKSGLLGQAHKTSTYQGDLTKVEEKVKRDTRYNDVDQDFGSQGSVNSIESDQSPEHKQSNVYSTALPTSTPLVKGMKVTQDSTSESRSQQWKGIGGPAFSKPHSKVNRGQPSRSQSPLKSSRSRSTERKTGDLVLRSAEFPSDLSRITQESSTDQQNLWRYKSLEDLIPHLTRADQGRVVQKDRQNVRGGRDMFTDGSRNQAEPPSHDRVTNERSDDFVSKLNHMYAPIKAMNSEFWEQQSGGDEDDLPDWSSHRPVTEKHSGFSKFNGHVVSRKNNENNHQMFNEGHSPTRHKTTSPFQGDQVSGVAQQKYEDNSDWLTHGSRSDPRLSRHPQLSQDEKSSNKQRQHTELSTSSTFFMREVVDLRRSLEELQPHQFLDQSASQKNPKNTRMFRSSSEQSLHTVHYDRGGHYQGQGSDHDIDAILSAYTSQLNFDLRPFPYDEQF